ncbi:RING/Ubox like zinc-binding domain-containing protein [Hirsutella rhossiliensis]|uniref:RING/Ubox like zinc-binding domain-containing protein n=1 Tax=Hirsutella rhossiliensis TaxID=111463 RepID=A0A9P8MSW8_9HYPO|nr:RING/Ubox like zinc-binding domain-containing protein [Hirsutella rhossiliensis]KAH0958587.1 RING/Ubox like zinc-binding domain-containing protein [Hirsutella rhossiliensis]
MAPQDSFIEEEEDVCPLCIEEFDLSDRNFRPCPCGYQVCQFCFNNIKNNMNGLCPACRRPYDEKTIQWKVVTQEEVAEFRANIQKNQKKRAQEQRQKEVQKREAEKENRKNLIGVRVVQKNLVYITGLAPTVREDELLKTLRKPEFFGQYGNIQKISISNRKSSDGQHHSLGIYVTFERPEEATRCIQAVHGSQNGDRVLKAQHGTTKYCSAWLKNEKCNNPGCMFLHEQGDEEDSYTRQDLSSMNSIHTQRPLPGGGGGTSSRAASRQQPAQPTPPPASQSMARSTSKDGSDNGVDTSALPSSANWARNPQRSRRGSHATSGAASSPAVSTSLPATTETTQQVAEDAEASAASATPKYKQPESSPVGNHVAAALDKSLRDMLRALEACTLPRLDDGQGGEADPPMFDVRGGEKRRVIREEDDTRVGDPEELAEVQIPSEGEPETGGGSLALGGEPEERDLGGDGHGFDQRQASSQPPIQRASIDGLFGSGLGSSNFGQSSARAMTPQHLASLRSQQGGFGEQMPPGMSNQSSMFQGQGHNRQSSRFSFANDNANSATNVKLAANSRIMAQQSSMMPNSFQSQGGNQFYGSSMPGPPPGLKSSGTPPSMFGQSFGGSGFGAAPKDSSNDLLQSLIGRNRGGGNQPHDAGKPPASGLLASLYGNHAGAFQDLGSKQKKKGKKHRHANTSSSGGSGLVDLADPSILQARMQHQSQSNAGVGQGLFGGQSQDDELPSLDEATNSVDALVSDEPQSVFAQSQPTPTAEAGRSAPPGLAPSHGHPEAVSKTSPAPSRSRPANIVPAVPRFSALGLDHGTVTPEQTPRKATHGSIFAVEHRLAKGASSQTRQSQSRGSAALQDEDFPALNAPRAREMQPASPAIPFVPTPKGTPAPKRPADKVSEKASEKAVMSPIAASAPFPETSNMKHGPVNADALKSVDDLAEDSSRSEGSTDHSATLPPIHTSSAGTASSPIQRAAPRSIRVMPTARAEGNTLPSPAHSVASKCLSLSHIPDTPGSEIVSDTASVLSASVSASRAESPPPSRIGSASVRSTTKSQQRKQRKEALKIETKVISEALKAEPEVHAPVVGRKKKQKKEKPARTTAGQPRAGTSPQGPVPEDKPAAKSVVQEETIVDKKKSSKGKSKLSPPLPAEPAPPPPPAGTEKPYPGPASVPLASSSSRQEHGGAGNTQAGSKSGYCKDCSCKCGEIHDDDLAALRAGKPVRKQLHVDGSRMLITPNGDCIRGLTPDEEDAFLDLQTAIAATAENPGAFVAPRHQPGSGAFSLIKGRAVPNGRPNIFPATSQPQPQDPIGKLQREDALSYINQYVLPRLNLGAGSMGLPKGASPMRDSAAASLNSLAPYFYGPDAAAGVGIYSAPDGARAMHDFASPPAAVGAGAAAGVGVGGAQSGGGDDGAKMPGGGSGGVGGMPLMSVEDAEMALAMARKETDKLEKGLNAVIKRNKRLLLGGGN